jgi:hypothetical protein
MLYPQWIDAVTSAAEGDRGIRCYSRSRCNKRRGRRLGQFADIRVLWAGAIVLCIASVYRGFAMVIPPSPCIGVLRW